MGSLSMWLTSACLMGQPLDHTTVPHSTSPRHDNETWSRDDSLADIDVDLSNLRLLDEWISKNELR